MSGATQTNEPGGGQTQAPPTNGTGAAPSADWIAGLTPELRQVVEVKGYKTPADVVQAYAHAQKSVGVDKITLPHKDTGAWDAESAEKLGIPKDPSGYKFDRPAPVEGLLYDEKFEQAALPVAHKLGLTPHQVKGLIDFYVGYQSESFKANFETGRAEMAQSEAALKQEWGTAYDVNRQRAAIAAKHFGGDKLVNFLNSSGFGNNPELIRAFAKVGALMTEDQLKVGQGTGFGLTPEQAQREARKLMATEAYQKREHPEHEEMQEKVAALFKQAHPD